MARLDIDAFYALSAAPKPKSKLATLERLLSKGYLRDTLEGTFDVTNLGALMLARDLSSFELLTDAEAEAIEAAYPTSFAGLNLPPDESDDGDADGGVA